jgi:hypothetical protein
MPDPNTDPRLWPRIRRNVTPALRANPMTAPFVPGPSLGEQAGRAELEARTAARARRNGPPAEASPAQMVDPASSAPATRPNMTPNYGEGVAAPGRPDPTYGGATEEDYRGTSPPAPVRQMPRGQGATRGSGGMSADQLNAAALRLAQGGQPQNPTEVAMKQRMDQLTGQQGSDPAFRPYKKGGVVKAYAKGGVVSKSPFPKKGAVPFPKVAVPKTAKPKAPVAEPMGSMRNSKMLMAKGGKVMAKAPPFEGSKKDMAQDKKMAAKKGMSLKQWEKSPADKKHDAPKGKPFKRGGKVKCYLSVPGVAA